MASKPVKINRRRKSSRHAMVSIEVVTTIAVMLPIAAALLFLGVRMSAALYEAISGMVSWPFL
jgi:hypothetical protein